jgi:hypothetical protein
LQFGLMCFLSCCFGCRLFWRVVWVDLAERYAKRWWAIMNYVSGWSKRWQQHVPRHQIHQRKEPSQKGTKKETALPNPQSLPRRSFPRGRRLPLPPERLQRFTFELAGKNCSNGSSTQGGGAVGHARKAARGTASGRLRSRRSAVSAGSSVGGLSSSPKSWWRWRHRREIGKGGHRGAGQTACLSSTSTSDNDGDQT